MTTLRAKGIKEVKSIVHIIQEFMQKHDNGLLYEVVFKEAKHNPMYVSAVHGNHKQPWSKGRSAKTRHYFRISVLIDKVRAQNLPNPRKMEFHGGNIRPENVYGTVAELLLWGFFHEYYHHLASTYQLPTSYKDERMADAFAYQLTDFYRKEIA